MKKILFLFILCVVAGNGFSQTYKKTKLLDKNILFSHLQLLDGKSIDKDIFEIRGLKSYSEDKTSSSYEVGYFKGNAKETYAFLSSLIELFKKIGKDDVVAYIHGIRVESFRGLMNVYLSVFDEKESVYCYFTVKQWNGILETFTTYCNENRIAYTAS